MDNATAEITNSQIAAYKEYASQIHTAMTAMLAAYDQIAGMGMSEEDALFFADAVGSSYRKLEKTQERIAEGA